MNHSFERWFRDSKIIDANGKPLIVYHGTSADFSVFGMGRGAIYFTQEPDIASEYAKHAPSHLDSAPNVMPAFISIKNPYVIDENKAKEFIDDDGEFDWTALDDELYAVMENGHDGAILYGVADFCGISVEGKRLEKTQTQFVVFHPKQIKSAIGNCGNFDRKSPDICK